MGADAGVPILDRAKCLAPHLETRLDVKRKQLVLLRERIAGPGTVSIARRFFFPGNNGSNL